MYEEGTRERTIAIEEQHAAAESTHTASSHTSSATAGAAQAQVFKTDYAPRGC